MTVVMKIDLVGPAAAASRWASTRPPATAASPPPPSHRRAGGQYAPRNVVWVGAARDRRRRPPDLACCSSATPRAHVALEQRDHDRDAWRRTRCGARSRTPRYRDPALRACSQAGLVNNLNDALAWGLVPLFLAAHGASVAQVGLVAAVYPGVWGVGQIVTGWLGPTTSGASR